MTGVGGAPGRRYGGDESRHRQQRRRPGSHAATGANGGSHVTGCNAAAAAAAPAPAPGTPGTVGGTGMGRGVSKLWGRPVGGGSKVGGPSSGWRRALPKGPLGPWQNSERSRKADYGQRRARGIRWGLGLDPPGHPAASQPGREQHPAEALRGGVSVGPQHIPRLMVGEEGPGVRASRRDGGPGAADSAETKPTAGRGGCPPDPSPTTSC